MMRSMEARRPSAATQNQARKVLGRVLRRAIQEELIHRNAATIADGPRIDRAERRSLTSDQARILLGALEKERLGTAYMRMLAIGLRRGEVLGLAWDDFDLDSVPPQVDDLPPSGGEAILGSDVMVGAPAAPFHVEGVSPKRRRWGPCRSRRGSRRWAGWCRDRSTSSTCRSGRRSRGSRCRRPRSGSGR